ncbi:aminotransferase class V-fold PLP-dependent enzyme [Planctellipticum variicoloris]|uniref:aminotransferase class V-fold PLP-dependent enzyme n=1 Tax=Planctellipticum variicoloris TaxID=3064265 RepID=UPI00301349C2|nr:aminotransferase class V-fold PLP-dependent enzyme [Planctomycetaceae bacterium SH412]
MQATDASTLPGREAWTIPLDVTYLNHGSFGPAPRCVQEERERWSRRLEQQPMDFFLREMEPQLDEARAVLGQFVGGDRRDLVFVDNATIAMNVVAASTPLAAGDEVLLNDHEYGAVFNIWRKTCQGVGAKVVTAALTTPISSAEQLIEELFAKVTPQTRLIVVSHVTSPTAAIFPVAENCRRARSLGIPVCIDGPHAPAMVPIDLRAIGCDFYCASLHKWVSAPFGSGFLYVARKRQSQLRLPLVSWGRSLGGRDECWQDEFQWMGTRDPAAVLAVPAAIRFLQAAGLDRFRAYGHDLARYARGRLEAWSGCRGLVPDEPGWYGTMVTVPLRRSEPQRSKPNAFDPLQRALWEQHRIEVPVMDWRNRRHLRVSCHLYNTRAEIDRLVTALESLEH